MYKGGLCKKNTDWPISFKISHQEVKLLIRQNLTEINFRNHIVFDVSKYLYLLIL